MGIRSVALRCFIAFLAVFFVVSLASAQEKPKDVTKVRGISVKALSGDYLAIKSANVRAKPNTKGKVVGRIAKGSRVEAIGKSGSWIALITEEGVRGFSYLPIFLPLIDGTLESDINVSTSLSGGGKCDIKVIFDGKTIVEEEMFEVSDYEALYDCSRKGGDISFTAYMFITEAPYRLNTTPHYQISVDLRDIGSGYDEIFSTVFIYKRRKGEIVYDGLTLKGYDKKMSKKTRSVATVTEAISAAAEMAPEAWGGKVWSELKEPVTR